MESLGFAARTGEEDLARMDRAKAIDVRARDARFRNVFLRLLLLLLCACSCIRFRLQVCINGCSFEWIGDDDDDLMLNEGRGGANEPHGVANSDAPRKTPAKRSKWRNFIVEGVLVEIRLLYSQEWDVRSNTKGVNENLRAMIMMM